MENANNLANDSATYLKGYRLYSLLISLMLGTMLVAIDNTIIGVAVPKITTEFKALDDIGWYSSAYLIAVTALQPTYGKVYKHFDVKIIYSAAIIVFEIGSVICATAFNSCMFIIGRAIAGIGAGAIFQGALGAINLVAPLPKRPFYFSIVVSVFALAVCIGPIIGGAITYRASWRWCFWINLPLGVFACIFSLVFLRFQTIRNAQKELSFWSKLRNMDGVGALTLVGGVTCLLLALQWGGQKLPWKSAKVIGLFIGFFFLIVSFGCIQWRLGEHATIPLRILRQRSILMGCIFIALLDMTAYTYAYYMPFYFQGVEGTTALTSGIRFMPLVIPQITAIVLSGAVVSKYGHYVLFMAFGPILTVVGTGLITHVGPDTPSIQLSSFLVVVGLGLGLCMQQPYTAVAMVLEPEDVPIGNAIMVFLQQLGGAVAVPIGETIFLNVILTEAPKRTPDIPPHTIIAAGSTNLKSLAPNASVLRALHILYSKAITRTFLLALVTAAVALPFAVLMDWRVPKKRSGEEIPETECPNNLVVMEIGCAEDTRAPSDSIRRDT